MSEARLIENHQYNDELLKYSDLKYKYALMRDVGNYGEDYIWSLTCSKEDAINKLVAETNAYNYYENKNSIENYNFYVCEIVRKEFPKDSMGKIYTSIHCLKIENLTSENLRK